MHDAVSRLWLRTVEASFLSIRTHEDRLLIPHLSHGSAPRPKIWGAPRWARLLPSWLVAALAVACAASAPTASWPPVAQKWFDRAEASYRDGDIEDADLSSRHALELLPNETSIRLLAAKVALAQLEYDRSIEHLRGLKSADASAVRGRALWYSGSIAAAGEELERLLADPEVKDPWASDVMKLARRGAGRQPFKISGGLLAVSEMPRVRGAALVVPLELDGEPALAMIATGTGEVVVDSGRNGEPKWVSLRFGERLEVHDVPALAKDLSGVSRQIDAPIKLLLGVNLLRQLHPTIDYGGDQFVVRTFEPPPPPEATTVPVHYVRGGGMLIRAALGPDEGSPWLPLLVDTSFGFPVALDTGGWKRAGVDPQALEPLPGAGQLRHGVLPLVRLGAYDLPDVPAYYGAPVDQIEQHLGVDLAGLVGSELVAAFRVTLVDGGRALWLEQAPRQSAPPPAESAPSTLPLLPDAAVGAEPAPEAPAPAAPANPKNPQP